MQRVRFSRIHGVRAWRVSSIGNFANVAKIAQPVEALNSPHVHDFQNIQTNAVPLYVSSSSSSFISRRHGILSPESSACSAEFRAQIRDQQSARQDVSTLDVVCDFRTWELGRSRHAVAPFYHSSGPGGGARGVMFAFVLQGHGSLKCIGRQQIRDNLRKSCEHLTENVERVCTTPRPLNECPNFFTRLDMNE